MPSATKMYDRAVVSGADQGFSSAVCCLSLCSSGMTIIIIGLRKAYTSHFDTRVVAKVTNKCESSFIPQRKHTNTKQTGIVIYCKIIKS